MGYDISTRNSSFIKMHLFLKNKGIQKNKFFLQLNDLDLLGVNPHAKNLDPKIVAKIIKEIYSNRWYFLREIALIPVPGGTVKYDLNRGNLAQSWCASKSINSATMLPRQQGKTIGVTVDDLYSAYFGSTNSEELYFNKSLPDSVNNLKRFKTLRSLLPQYLRDYILDSKNDVDNEKQITSYLTKTTIHAKSAPTDPVTADKLGRGATVPFLYFDEFAFMKYNSIVYKAASPAFSKAHEMAVKMGQPSCKKITTTPNDISLEEALFCKKLMDNACQFDEMMYDMPDDELYDFIDKNSSNDFVNIIFYWRELGLTEKWYKDQCKNLENDLLIIKREIDLEWTQSNDMSVFNEGELELIRGYLRDPSFKLVINKYYAFNFFENIHPDISYIIAVDISGGLEQDKTAISILHPLDLHTVGEFTNNTVTGPEICSILESLVLTYLSNSLVVIERNSYGLVVIQMLLKDKEDHTSPIVPNLYWEVKEVMAQKTLNDGRIKKSKVKKKVYGHTTDTKTRPIMINEILKDLVKNDYDKIISDYLYHEIKTLVRNHGKIEHAGGEHDDLLIATLIARYTVLYGTNYKSFKKNYGSGKVDQSIKKNVENMRLLSTIATSNNMLDINNSSSLLNGYVEDNKKYEETVLKTKKSKFETIFGLNE